MLGFYHSFSKFDITFATSALVYGFSKNVYA